MTLTRAHPPQWLRTLERVTTHEEEMVEQVSPNPNPNPYPYPHPEP